MKRGPKPTCDCGNCHKCHQRKLWMDHYRRNRQFYSAVGMHDYLEQKRKAESKCGGKLH